MGVLKFILWFLFACAFVPPQKERNDHSKLLLSIEFSVIVLCLTIIYTFGGK